MSPHLYLMSQLVGLEVPAYATRYGWLISIPQIVLALPAAWFLERFGQRKLMFVFVLFISLRTTFFCLLYSKTQFAGWIQLRQAYWTAAYLCVSVVQTIFYILPLKISETWFSVEQRTLAWACLDAADFLGQAAWNYALPRLVESQADAYLLRNANLICCLTSVALILFGVTRSKPKYPPNERSDSSNIASQQSIATSLKNIVTNRNVMLVLLYSTFVDSVYIAMQQVMEDVLSAAGYPSLNQFVGVFLSIVLLTNFIAQFVFSYLVSDTDTSMTRSTARYKLVAVNGFCALCLYLFALNNKDSSRSSRLIILSVLAVSLMVFSTINQKNMATYLISGQVAESVFAAAHTFALVIFSGVYFFVLMHFKATDHETHRPDYSIAFLVIASSSGLYLLSFLLFFKAERKVMPLEADRLCDDEASFSVVISLKEPVVLKSKQLEQTNKAKKSDKYRINSIA